ncbi:MAG: PD40 domain-containing protein [Melioribacteraceae bacterium]|nr:PD40 domain-containing protein [Melioribacteraceae bacterium]
MFTSLISAQNSPLALSPSLNPDGSIVAFTYQGDIWTVPAEGGIATRLTIHQANDSKPKWCPSGKAIAFSSNRFGNNDIFRIPFKGGLPERLTYRSSNDVANDWTTEGEILFTTSRDYRQIEWDTEVYKVSINGGTPVRILDSFGSEPALSPDGKFMVFVRGYCRTSREDYRGPANKELWIFNTKTKEYKKLTEFEGNDYNPVWGNTGTIYFISARSGVYNIHSLKIDDNGNMLGAIVPLTKFEDDGIRYFDISANGKLIAFERRDNIYTVKTDGGEAVKLNIEIGADYRFDPNEIKTFSDELTEYDVSPNGELSALVVHGEVFITENDKEKSKTINVSKHPYRDEGITWLNDSTLIFVSDRDGNFDLYLAKSADKENSNIFTSLKHEIVKLSNTDVDESNPLVSPDGKKIAYAQGRGKFIVAEINTDGSLSGETVLLDGWDKPGGVKWSPDSKWLAYSLSDLNFNDEIYIQAADGSKDPVNISMHPRGDYNPVWSRDGSKLGFISARNNQDNDVWFVWLKKDDFQKTKEDWDETKEDKKDEKKDKKDSKDDKDKKKDKEVEPIQIDFDGIYERLVQVTRLAGDESNVEFSKDGKTVFFVSKDPTAKGTDLYKVNWDGKKLEAVTKGGQKPGAVSLEPKAKYLYMIKSGKLARLETSKTAVENLPFKGKMKLDYLAENEQIFEEAWRNLRDGFYDPDFHGNDWNALKAKYKPWILKASTKDDFRYMVNIMLGQLNASHMGLYGEGREKTQKITTGLLGVDIVPVENGVKVERVIKDAPADKTQSKLNNGDIITAVNGEEVNNEVNFYSLFDNTSKEQVLLTVEDKTGNIREVVIRPKSSLRSELYNEWVKDKRALVDKYSGRKLGYLHIRGMDMNSFERFERELMAAGHGKDGIVIDVRYNGGGWTTDYLMALLNVKQHAYTIPRGAAESLKEHKKFRENYAFGERLPFSIWNKPSIALCNANSYSNAEIFSHAYKTLGIGKLVGIPTFGAVISTGGKGLIDGSYVRMPFRAWFVKATDQNMELGPAVPDFILDNSPNARALGVDEQLKKAVDELLKDLN